MSSILCPRCGEQNDTALTGVRCRQCGLPLPVLSLDAPEAVVPGLPAQAPWREACGTERLNDAAREPPNIDIAQPTLRLTEEEVQAFVGPGASYYLECWQPALAEGGQPRGFNLGAALFAGLWLPYRKLYSATALFFGCLILAAFVERYFFLHMQGLAEVPISWALATALVFAGIVGARANRMFWNKARDAIWDVRRQALATEQHYHALARRGGRSVRAAVAMPLLGIGAVATANLLLDRLPIFNEIRRLEETVRAGMEHDQKIRVAECKLARRPDGNIAGTLTEVGGEQWDVLRVWTEGRQVRWYFAEPVSRLETRMRAEVAERIGDPVRSAQLRKNAEGRVSGTIETEAGVVCDVLQTPPEVFPPQAYWQINEESYASYLKVATRKDDFSLAFVRLEPHGKAEWRGVGTDRFGAQYDIVLRARAPAGGGPGDARLGAMLEWELTPKNVPVDRREPQAPWRPGNGQGGQRPGWPPGGGVPGWGPRNPFGPLQPLRPQWPIAPLQPMR